MHPYDETASGNVRRRPDQSRSPTGRKGGEADMTTRSEPGDRRDGETGHTVVTERQHLINLTYRLLGSLSDAEDAVQETYARWYAMTPRERDAIDVPGAWLSRVAGRICLDLLRSARVRREKYVGQWLPEPLPDRAARTQTLTSATEVDPADRVTLDESISMAFLVMLESMTPAERVAFILHDVFGYAFADIAEIVGRTPEACRQLASSARRRVRRAEPPVPTPVQRVGAQIVRDFKQAWEAKDVDALIGLLDPDSTAVADGGGNATAAPHPIDGAEQIASFFADVADTAPDLTIEERTVNGQPGLVAQTGGVTVTVLAFDITGDRITHIWAVRNPDKLHPWT